MANPASLEFFVVLAAQLNHERMRWPTQKRVLVTAGAAGIGRAIVQAFAAAGAKVHVGDLDAAALAALRAQLPGVSTAVCDVGERGAVESMVADAAEALDGLDVLVNNAGISGPTASVEQMDP